MSHVVLNQSKLLARTRRISGQLAAVEKAIAEGVDCAAVLTHAHTDEVDHLNRLAVISTQER